MENNNMLISNALELLLNKATEENREFSKEEKLKAAYALNLCMVSVSQIIDYDDIIILEQEYEMILNNLNLENIPKDEALLNILKQLLDVITFFRIQEGDKKFIDRDYQQKMKNAIWSAVPNLGVIIATRNPLVMVVSLASQVGTAYMNYRKAKSKIVSEYEKEMWELQKAAIEQFNGLRRELFDTAWRLADKYQFPDEYRLTERQIKQYDEILMDSDEIRKFERLSAIKDKFIAYPPFWYQYGNTANYISRDMSLELSETSRGQYRKKAIEAFEHYWQTNKYNLLREDEMAASCALEYIDLLDVNIDRDKINELLSYAVKMSGNALDVLQLCALSYLKLNEREEAERLLRILVNESYNTNINAQILSSLYVSKFLSGDYEQAIADYEILATRISSSYLLRLPRIGENVTTSEIEQEFAESQQELLKSKYQAVILKYMDEYSIKMNKLIPVEIELANYSDSYFSPEAAEKRIKQFRYMSDIRRERYAVKVFDSDFVNNYFMLLNKFFEGLIGLSLIDDVAILQDNISEMISKNAQVINDIQGKVADNSKELTMQDFVTMMNMTLLKTFLADFVNCLFDQIGESVEKLHDMSSLAKAESDLREFCIINNIPEPDEIIFNLNNARLDDGIIEQYFGLELLGNNGLALAKEKQNFNTIANIIKYRRESLLDGKAKATIYMYDEPEFDDYIRKNWLKKHRDIWRKAIAIFDDKSLTNQDFIFMPDGFVPIIKGQVKEKIVYSDLAKYTGQYMTNDIKIITAVSPLAGLIAYGISDKQAKETAMDYVIRFNGLFKEIEDAINK